MPMQYITLTKVCHQFVCAKQRDTFYAAYLATRQA